MTTVHGQFFSNSNKEYVSTAVFQNVKEELGVELDATFVENLMKIMAETYSNNERPRNTNVEDYVETLNSIVVQKCYEKVKNTSEKLDYNKLTQRAAEEREYEFNKLAQQAHQQDQHKEPREPRDTREPREAREARELSETRHIEDIQTTKPVQVISDKKTKQMIITLDFRKDLIDVKDNSYCLKLQKETYISSLIIKKFMIELCDSVVSEPYIYVDIENFQDEDKVCFVEDKKVIGRMVQQSSTVCNKTMYLYEQEDCIIELKTPVKTNHLFLSFYDYNGNKLNLKKLNAKKVIKLENSDLNQVLTTGSNTLKSGDTINVVTTTTKESKLKCWNCSQVTVSEAKSNSIICSKLPSMEEKGKLVLEKKILNSNISMVIFYKN